MSIKKEEKIKSFFKKSSELSLEENNKRILSKHNIPEPSIAKTVAQTEFEYKEPTLINEGDTIIFGSLSAYERVNSRQKSDIQAEEEMEIRA